MEFLQGIMNSYSNFFSAVAFKEAIFTPASWAVIGTLIVLEGLLSADNALVLAVMVRHLPRKERKKALFYGIFGAYFFRFLVIGVGVTLIHIAWIKIICGHYLLWIVFQNLLQKKEEEDDIQNKRTGFWRTVLTVELMDISFSFDSIMAAFGVSSQEWVLFLGGILGILMMRGVAHLFLVLIEKVPELETTAFLLIAMIALKMIASAFGFQMAELVFFSLLMLIFLGTFVVHLLKRNSERLI